jgi:hypothetical protein
MAILSTNDDGTYEGECPLCDRPLCDPLFGTTHFVSDTSDRLYPYSDAVMHWECYASWKYQKRFAAQYFDFRRLWMHQNEYWACIASTNTFLVAANPNLAEPMTHIDFRSIGPGFRVPIARWTNWLAGDWDACCCNDLQRYAILEVEDELRLLVPDSDSLLSKALAIIEDRGRTMRCTEVADRPFHNG